MSGLFDGDELRAVKLMGGRVADKPFNGVDNQVVDCGDDLAAFTGGFDGDGNGVSHAPDYDCRPTNVNRPRLLDLFCCEGGGAVGYDRAGFDVTGIDILKQRRYPFSFIQADALRPPVRLSDFDAVHASPPCQAYSVTKHTHAKQHVDLVGATLELLAGFDGPWVVENVVGAPLPNPVELCGAALQCEATDIDGERLVLKRHRLFSSNVMLMIPPCGCAAYRYAGVRVGGVYGGGPENRKIANRSLGTFRGGYTPTKDVCAELIGCTHMTKHGLSQAIPPAYTEHIGAQLMAVL